MYTFGKVIISHDKFGKYHSLFTSTFVILDYHVFPILVLKFGEVI